MAQPFVSKDEEIAQIRQRLAALESENAGLHARLRELCTSDSKKDVVALEDVAKGRKIATRDSPAAEKVALFRSLFRGREDIFPRRWSNTKSGRSGYAPVCDNEWVPDVCGKPKIKCGECPNCRFVPVNDDAIRWHLQGEGPDGRDYTLGIYPLLTDETCWFLAVDFDKHTWQRDAAGFMETCRRKGVPAVLERSRSGNGGHVWMFFTEPVPAAQARKLAAHILTETMERCPEIGFESYDRFFPSQDTMSVGGFGNLIALPLQRSPRENGNSVFLDEHFEPYADQWRLMSSIKRMSLMDVSILVDEAERRGQILGVRLPITDDDEEPWFLPPSRRKPEMPLDSPAPPDVELVIADQIYIPRRSLPASLVNRLIRLAAFQNPEFYSAQAMRLPTFGKPRIISCAELSSKHVALPRGCLDQAKALLESVGVKPHFRDERSFGTCLEIRFLGELTTEQAAARDAVLKHETGVLAATTAFGKTVVAASVIAERRRNSLILVHRQQLLDHWVARLATFLDLPSSDIGQIGGGKKRPSGNIDVALIQSLVRKGEVDDIVANYGHLVVDECHHLPAVSFEAVARRCKAKYVLGLSATVTRRDGHHPIIFMQCGPVRFRVDARDRANARPFRHTVVIRYTSFNLPAGVTIDRPAIQELYASLSRDTRRNDLIFDDVLRTLEARRSPVILTERTEHAQLLADRLSRFARNVIVLRGGAGARERKKIAERLAAIGDHEERVLIATGRYLGEGFDDARLDTLFLTMPISWRGTLAQYAGRLHRLHPAKREVIVYDYVDEAVPVLVRMSAKRRKSYERLGYQVKSSCSDGLLTEPCLRSRL